METKNKFREFEIVKSDIDPKNIVKSGQFEDHLDIEITTLTTQHELLAIQLATSGKSKKAICRELNISEYNMASYVKKHLAFANLYNQALSVGYDSLADELLELVDKEIDTNKAKIKSDNIKWLLSKRKPHTYGDKLEVNMNATVDISAALTAAKSRVVNSDPNADDDIFS